MSWEGGNFEDAILISERIVREDLFTVIHIEKHEVDARDTKLGPEEITRDIPNVGEEGLRNLDERGIIYVGAEVGPRRHPGRQDHAEGRDRADRRRETAARDLRREGARSEGHVAARAARRAWQGRRGQGLLARDGDELPPGVNQTGARQHRAEAQDWRGRQDGRTPRQQGRDLSSVLPIEDMPFLPDGTPVDIILNPLGVPHRMNIGQIMETHLGWAAEALGLKVATPVFDGASEEDIEAALRRAACRKPARSSSSTGARASRSTSQ